MLFMANNILAYNYDSGQKCFEDIGLLLGP